MVDTHAAALAIVTASVTLQVLTAVSALRLISLTRYKLPWAVLASAFTLMAVRRCIPLWRALMSQPTSRVDLFAEGIALAISIAMFVGVLNIRPLFESMQRADRAVRASERRYRRLFDWHQGINLVVDRLTGRVTDANHAAIEFYGATRERLRERTLAGLSVDAGAAAEQFSKLASEGGTFPDRHGDANGQPRDVEVRAWPVDEEEGESGSLHVVVSDVTDRRATEATLRSANDELRRWVSELERHRHDSEIHIELNALLQSCESVAEVGEVVQRLVPALFPDGGGALYLDKGTAGTLTCFARWGSDPPPDNTFPSEDCWAFRRGQMHITENPASGLLCQHLFDRYEGFSLCMPVRSHGGTPGLITLRGSRRLRETSGQRQARLLADTIGLAVANLRLRDTLREQSTRDALTGLYNRRYLEETLARELARADRTADPVSVLMIDLDHFKSINDSYGHTAGDRVLQSLADLLRRHVRVGDVVCRYGGEEFAVVMPGASAELALDRAEVLRRATHAVELPGPGPTQGVLSMSVGIAVFPKHARTAALLLRSADEALYAAKHNGRDCIALPPNAAGQETQGAVARV